jgi:hypothetical protein
MPMTVVPSPVSGLSLDHIGEGGMGIRFCEWVYHCRESVGAMGLAALLVLGLERELLALARYPMLAHCPR